ncbi:hypothetical protein TMUPMC115_1601 [Tetragenococcus muriaticus PMC-11-5]|uniref:Uncharacterized protein n=2 Tax=Tetragenococcus muriaticus TaxID=64642 RepID=A0A091C347_9ENTE|nr:hypothetical protein TMUPMC115_1601 [Tetragenococcus muriaticus PMC-11-5]
MSVDSPEKPMVEKDFDGILFFTEEEDDWFFKGYNLTVDYDETLDEPKYNFSER